MTYKIYGLDPQEGILKATNEHGHAFNKLDEAKNYLNSPMSYDKHIKTFIIFKNTTGNIWEYVETIAREAK